MIVLEYLGRMHYLLALDIMRMGRLNQEKVLPLVIMIEMDFLICLSQILVESPIDFTRIMGKVFLLMLLHFLVWEKLAWDFRALAQNLLIWILMVGLTYLLLTDMFKRILR